MLRMKRRFKVMTTNHSLLIAPNILNRDFYASKVDEKYALKMALISRNPSKGLI